MICNLHIKNIGIIDDLSIDLNNGFNVLTGETGAGKTLIIDSLQILSGSRFSKEIIRNGENYSFVELSLFIPDNDFCEEENIVISREVHISGRNLCKINGRMVTVTELKEFMKNVIDIHGQNDNQSILGLHLELLWRRPLRNGNDLWRSRYGRPYPRGHGRQCYVRQRPAG